jgi:hypothetical protein
MTRDIAACSLDFYKIGSNLSAIQRLSRDPGVGRKDP